MDIITATTPKQGYPQSSTVHLQPRSPVNNIDMQYMYRVTANNSISESTKCILDLMFTYGLRIQEVLNIKYMDIYANGTCFIYGLKKSRARVVQHAYLLLVKRNNPTFSPERVFSQSYHYIYRLLKNLFPQSFFLKTKIRLSITKTFRANFIKRFDIHTNHNKQSVADVVGHNSQSSQSFYLNNK